MPSNKLIKYSSDLPYLRYLQCKTSARHRRSIWTRKCLRKHVRSPECLECRGVTIKAPTRKPCYRCALHFQARCTETRDGVLICKACTNLSALYHSENGRITFSLTSPFTTIMASNWWDIQLGYSGSPLIWYF